MIGHHVLVAILDELDKSSNSLIDATDIIVHGSSAGEFKISIS